MQDADNIEEQLVHDEGPNVDLLLQEYKQAGVMPNGWYDLAFNEETRRMIWAGQSPDGRKWDENMPEGEPARPWNGCSDTRVPMVDSVANDDTAMLKSAFKKAELRATAMDPDKMEMATGISGYLHWWVHTRYRKALRLEVELSAQYSREYGFCVAYVGWERELGKRRLAVKIEELTQLVQTLGPEWAPFVPAIQDPEQVEAAAAMLQALYATYVQGALEGKGFFEDELSDNVLKLSVTAAKRCVKELRESGETELPMPYVCKNQPCVWVGKPYMEMLAARGTMQLQQARAIFWKRWMTETELEAKRAEGWNPAWIAKVKNTKGNVSSWAGALGATSLTGPSTKTVGNTTYLKITEENNPLIEVVYAFVKKVDDDGVTGVYQTIFSPHVTNGDYDEELFAKHELLDYAHGRYPFVEFKRENIGRALTDTRSVAEVASTWQNEEKKQRDMLFNRADWDTLPPVGVPKLGGVDYRLGPGGQVPLGKNQKIEAITLNAPPPTLALELVKMLRLQKDDYFGQFNAEVHPAKIVAKQENSADDFYTFWGEVLLQMFALQLQYNPAEIDKVTGMPLADQLDPFAVLDQFDIGIEFDIKDLNPDYLLEKLDIIHGKILPGDAGGVLDRAALTNLETRWVDPRLAAKVVQDKGAASQKIYRDMVQQVGLMALGQEGEYTENDPTAPMKLQFLQTILQGNPKYLAKLGKIQYQGEQPDERFVELVTNFEKNLLQSKMQEENKTVGRIGVKPVGTTV